MSDEKKPTLESLTKALADAQAVIANLNARLSSLGNGRDESLRALTAARDELDRVIRERDDLREHLIRVEGMQTTTLTLPPEIPQDEEVTTPAESATLPSIDDLMADLSSIRESPRGADGHLSLKVTAPGHGEASEELLPPSIVFPEEYGAEGRTSSGKDPATTRVLVLLDGKQPIKYPLYKNDMTIGRVDAADIKIYSHFISRMHARIVTTEKGVSIEDIESKNGIKVNGKLAPRHSLQHGDLVSLGGLHLRFLDIEAGEAG